MIAADMDLFNTIANHDGPMKIQDIIKSTKGDEVLVQRIVRFLTAHKLIDQIDSETYVANRMTKEYCKDHWVALIRMLYVAIKAAVIKTPRILTYHAV